MRRKTGSWIVVTAAVLAVTCSWPADSSAAVSGTAVDPQDTLPALSGAREIDISHVTVSYEPADGTLSVTVRTYEPWSVTSKGYPRFSVSIGSEITDYDRTCVTYRGNGAQFTGTIDPEDSFSGSLSLNGFSGGLSATRTFSADGFATTWTVSSPVMANAGYRCVSSIQLYRPDPDGHCSPSLSNCQRISYSYTGDTVNGFFFDGMAPPPFACADGVDNDDDGKIDLADSECYSATVDSEGARKAACGNGRDDDADGLADKDDPGCRGKASAASETDPAPVRSRITELSASGKRRCRIDVAVEVQPDLTPEKLFPFGPVTIKVRGVSGAGKRYRRTRRLPLRENPGYAFRVKSGRYRVSASYPGDRFRLASSTRTRNVTVRCPRRSR